MDHETYQAKRYYVASIGAWSFVFKSYWKSGTWGIMADIIAAGNAMGIAAGFSDWDDLVLDGPFYFGWQARMAMKRRSTQGSDAALPVPVASDASAELERDELPGNLPDDEEPNDVDGEWWLTEDNWVEPEDSPSPVDDLDSERGDVPADDEPAPADEQDGARALDEWDESSESAESLEPGAAVTSKLPQAKPSQSELTTNSDEFVDESDFSAPADEGEPMDGESQLASADDEAVLEEGYVAVSELNEAIDSEDESAAFEHDETLRGNGDALDSAKEKPAGNESDLASSEETLVLPPIPDAETAIGETEPPYREGDRQRLPDAESEPDPIDTQYDAERRDDGA